jgi:hypothetical protein
MQNTNTATSGQTGQFPPNISIPDTRRLRESIQKLDAGEMDQEMFDHIVGELAEKYSQEKIQEAIDRFRKLFEDTQGDSHEDQPTPKIPNILFYEDFMSKPITEPPRLIDGILHQGCIMLLTGAAKTNKSWTAKEISISIAQGSEWIGFQCAQGRVLYINNEIADFVLQRRLDQLTKVMGAIPKGKLGILDLVGVPINYEGLTEHLIKTCKPGDYSLIVIDPIYTLLSDANENDNKDVALVGESLKQIKKETGSAVIFVHHHSKGGQGGKRSIDRSSGAGTWGRFPDAVLDIDRRSDRDKIFEMSLTLRNFDAPDNFLARRIIPGPIWERCSMTPDELKANEESAKQAAKEREIEDLCKKVADLVGNGERVNNTQWEKRCDSIGIGRRKFEEARDWLLENMIARTEKGSGNSKIYYFEEIIGHRFQSQD